MHPDSSSSSDLRAPATQEDARRVSRTGMLILLAGLVPLAVWVVTAPLSMAVVAQGYVKVDLNRRPVQHLEGGIVRTVLVRDGQIVSKGEPILMLGDVGVDADRNRLEYRLNVERAGMARLEAEQAGSAQVRFLDDIRLAASRDDRVQQALVKEQALFDSRRNSLASEVALLRKQRDQIELEASALRAQIVQVESSLQLQQADLARNRLLLTSGFISPNRLSQIESGVVDYAGKLEERRSELARAGQRLGEVDLKIQSLHNAYVQTASDQLKATAARIGEIEQEMRKSDDAAARQIVSAPADGAVIELKFTSPGAVIRPGDPIAEIVPSEASLMIEAHVRPEEINHVQVDQRARIKFMAFKYRNSSLVTGTVSYVSPDRLIDRATNQAYFSVMIVADAHSLASVGNFNLQAGMPAEVYIEGSKQTPLQYLLEPITSTIRKAGRQL